MLFPCHSSFSKTNLHVPHSIGQVYSIKTVDNSLDKPKKRVIDVSSGRNGVGFWYIWLAYDIKYFPIILQRIDTE